MKAPPPKPPTTTPIAMPLLCGNQRMPIVIVGIRAMACSVQRLGRFEYYYTEQNMGLWSVISSDLAQGRDKAVCGGDPAEPPVQGPVGERGAGAEDEAAQQHGRPGTSRSKDHVCRTQ